MITAGKRQSRNVTWLENIAACTELTLQDLGTSCGMAADGDQWRIQVCDDAKLSQLSHRRSLNTISVSHKAVTRIYFRGFFCHPFRPFPSLIPLLFPPPRSGLSHPAKEFGERCIYRTTAWRNNDICGLQTHSITSKYTKTALAAERQPLTQFGVFRAQETSLMAAPLQMSSYFC